MGLRLGMGVRLSRHMWLGYSVPLHARRLCGARGPRQRKPSGRADRASRHLRHDQGRDRLILLRPMQHRWKRR